MDFSESWASGLDFSHVQDVIAEILIGRPFASSLDKPRKNDTLEESGTS